MNGKSKVAAIILGIAVISAILAVPEQLPVARSLDIRDIAQKSVSIPVTADTYTILTSNHGDEDYFNLGGTGEGVKMTPLLNFDVASFVPSGSTIISARLKIVGTRPGGAFWGFPFSIYPISEPWDEITVTFNNRPSYHSNIVVSHELSETNSTMEFDISEIAQKWVNGEIDNFGLFLFADVIQSSEGFYSKESNTGLSPTLEVVYTSPPKSWTIMYFLAQDNDLNDHGALQIEWLRKAAENENINIVIFFDGRSAEASFKGLAPSIDGDFEVKKGEVSTGNPEVLREFVNWSINHYPADHYALVLSDHASGVTGFGLDEHPQDDGTDCVKGRNCMTFREIQQALAPIPKLDIIYLEACSSATLEVAVELRDEADYLIASQQIAWIPNDYHEVLESVDSSTQPEYLAMMMAVSYIKNIQNNPFDPKPGTISVLDLAMTNSASAAAKELAAALELNMGKYGETLTSILSEVQHFDSDGDMDIDAEDEFVDLAHFAILVAEKIDDDEIKNKAVALRDVLVEFVRWKDQRSGKFYKYLKCVKPGICDWHLENSRGVSVYFPTFSRSFYKDGWLDFTEGTIWNLSSVDKSSLIKTGQYTGWGSMLVEYVRQTSPDVPDDPNPPSLQPPLSTLSDIYLPISIK